MRFRTTGIFTHFWLDYILIHHLGRKIMNNLDSILKSRDITLPTKIHLLKALSSCTMEAWLGELEYHFDSM